MPRIMLQRKTPVAIEARRLVRLVACAASAIALFGACAAAESPAERGADSKVGYPSAEAAFYAVFVESGLGMRAYEENREYAAAIFEMPDGRWHCTPVSAGDRGSSLIPYHLVPAEALRIAGAHTHGRPQLPGDATHVYGADFSAADRRNALLNYRMTRGRIDTQLLLSSELKVLRLRLDGRSHEIPASWSPEGQGPLRTEVLGALESAAASPGPAQR